MLKKIKLIAIINIFILSFISHYIYDLFPSILISFFFPVNESIAEHMKIIYTSTLVYGLFDYLLLKYNNIKFQNFRLNLFLTSTLSIVIFLIIYLPIYTFFGEHLIITLIILLLTYVISQYISYIILTQKNYNHLNDLAVIFIILTYITFIIYTYNPPRNPLFFDTLNKGYGIINFYTLNN